MQARHVLARYRLTWKEGKRRVKKEKVSVVHVKENDGGYRWQGFYSS